MAAEEKELSVISEKKEVKSFIKNAQTSVDYAEKLVINNPEAEQVAVKALGRVKDEFKRGDTIRKFFTDSLNEQVKKINAMFMPNLKLFEQAERIIRGKMGDYQLALQKKADAAKDKVEDKIDAGEITIEQGVKKLDKIKEPEKTVRSEEGTLTYKDVPELVVVDEKLIPDEYWVIDMKKLETVAFANHKAQIAQIPGVEVKMKKVPSLRR